MIEREFEDYLALLRGLLRLRKSQCDAIADELRDHMDARLEDLLAEGIPREKAVQIALEEFGDAAGVGQAFLELNRTNQRRMNMKVTAASLLTCTALGLAAMAFWPDSTRHVSNPVMAQAGGGAGAGPSGPGGIAGMPPQHVRTREENNALTAEILSRASEEGLELDNTQLKEAVHHIRDATRTQFNIIFDRQKLEEASVDTSAPISLTLTRGVRFDTMLELMLKSVHAGYYIHDGIVIITSEDALAAVTEVRVYNVADLVYLDSPWPLDPAHGRGGMGPVGPPGMMGPGGMGPGGMAPGMYPGGSPYGSGGYGAGGGEGGGPGGMPGTTPGGPRGGPSGIGGGGGPPTGIGGQGTSGGPPPGIGAPGAGPGGPRGGGKGAPGTGGGVPGGPPGSSGAAPGIPGAPSGASPGGVSLPGEGTGSSGANETPSGGPESKATSSFEVLKSIITAPEQFLAQMGASGGGGMPAGAGSGGSGEAGGMMGGMGGGLGGGFAGPKYFSKNPEAYSPEERRAVDLIQAITSAVETNSWVDNGGEGEIRPFEGLLIVRNTPKAHQGVELLLQQIRSARHMHGGGMGGMATPGGSGGFGGYGGGMGGLGVVPGMGGSTPRSQ